VTKKYYIQKIKQIIQQWGGPHSIIRTRSVQGPHAACRLRVWDPWSSSTNCWSITVQRLQFIMRLMALKSEISRLSASSQKSNHKSLTGLDQCTVLRIVVVSMHMCCERTWKIARVSCWGYLYFSSWCAYKPTISTYMYSTVVLNRGEEEERTEIASFNFWKHLFDHNMYYQQATE
jgi:hypothetical protein